VSEFIIIFLCLTQNKAQNIALKELCIFKRITPGNLLFYILLSSYEYEIIVTLVQACVRNNDCCIYEYRTVSRMSTECSFP
jgi:hypothetical protein